MLGAGAHRIRRDQARGLLRLLAIAVCVACCAIPSKGATEEAEVRRQPFLETTNQTRRFSKYWMQEMLTSGTEGECSPVRGVYEWRNVGWCSNINIILTNWIQSISLGMYNFAVDVSPSFVRISCQSGTNETALVGWECMFKPMPHLCSFDTQEMKQEFITGETRSGGYAGTATPAVLRDKVETSAALLGFLYSNIQPWFRDDIEGVLGTTDVASIRSGRYVALHVRRGDKLVTEAQKIEVHVYLQAAALELWRSSGDHSGVDSIAGIWISSDDSSVLEEVQGVAASYFPNVDVEKIISISFRTPTPGKHNGGDELPTTSDQMTYELYVGFHAELQMMSEADVFGGTFSSNIGRVVYLMRERNEYPRNSTISVDLREWYLG